MTETRDRAPSRFSAAQTADLRRRELGAFLRDRRERIAPQQVGLTPVGRRRTRGCAGRNWPSSRAWA